jgi:hypothetical protein
MLGLSAQQIIWNIAAALRCMANITAVNRSRWALWWFVCERFAGVAVVLLKTFHCNPTHRPVSHRARGHSRERTGGVHGSPPGPDSTPGLVVLCDDAHELLSLLLFGGWLRERRLTSFQVVDARTDSVVCAPLPTPCNASIIPK